MTDPVAALKHAHETDSLGQYVADRIAEEVLGNPKLSEASRKALKPCLKHIATAVEKACPGVMVPTDNGVVMGYGAFVPPTGVMLVAANPRKAIAVVLQSVPDNDPDPLPSDIEAGDYWGALHEFVKADNIDVLPVVMFSRGPGPQPIRDFIAKAQGQLVPVIVAICASSKDRACGAMMMVPLPPVRAAAFEMENDAGPVRGPMTL
jgi:hypothetical protein